jgi:hypothetical protein
MMDYPGKVKMTRRILEKFNFHCGGTIGNNNLALNSAAKVRSGNSGGWVHPTGHFYIDRPIILTYAHACAHNVADCR